MDRMDLLSLCRDGIFSAADARAVGIDGSELRRLTGAGPACHRLLRGWYAGSGRRTILPPAPDFVDLHDAKANEHRLRSWA